MNENEGTLLPEYSERIQAAAAKMREQFQDQGK